LTFPAVKTSALYTGANMKALYRQFEKTLFTPVQGMSYKSTNVSYHNVRC